MVGAAGGDVDRHVADEPHAALRGVRAQGVPLAVEADLVLEGSRGRRTRSIPRSSSSRARGRRPPRRRSPARRGRRAARARPRTPSAPCTASRSGRAVRAAASATTTAPRLPASPRTRRRRRPTGPTEGTSDGAGRRPSEGVDRVSCRFDPAVRGIDVNSCPREQSANRPRGSRSSMRSRSSTAVAIPPSARREMPSSSRPTSSVTATRSCAPSCAGAALARRTGTRRRCAMSTPPTRACAGRARSRSASPAAGRSRSRRGRTRSRRGARSSTARSPRAYEDLSGELSEGRAAARARRRPRRGRRPRDARAGAQRRARHLRADRHARGSGAGARPPGRRPALARPAGVDDPAAARRARRRPRAGPVRLVVRAVPALLGRVRGGPRAAPAPRRARLRRPVPAADPPDRRHQPQGRQQRARRRPGRSRQPVGDRRRDRRPRRDPPGPGHARRVRRARRRGPSRRRRDLPRLRDPVLGRPSVAHGPPRVVQPPPGRDAEVRREPAQEVPGHLQRQLAVRGLAPALAGAAGRGPLLGHARRARLPRRQPAHEADPVLGVADPQGPRPVPRRRLPRRGVHAAGDDAHARRRSASASPTRTSRGRARASTSPSTSASWRAAGSRSTSAPTSS